MCDCLLGLIVALVMIGIVTGSVALIIRSNAPRVERERLQKLHEEEEKLLNQQLVKQIYAKIQSWDNDGLEVESFAQQILRQIGKF